MPRILVVSDNPLLLDVYEMNLRAYTGVDVVMATKIESFSGLLREEQKWDIVVLNYTLEQKEVAQKTIDHLKNWSVRPSLAVVNNIGDLDKVFSLNGEFITVKNPFDIKFIVQLVAKNLGITARHMAQKEIGAYFAIPYTVLHHLEQLNQDIFLLKQGQYQAIFQKGQEISAQALAPYDQQSIDYVYIESQYRLRFVNYASLEVIFAHQAQAQPQDKMGMAEASLDFIAESFIHSPESVQAIASLAKNAVTLMSEVASEVVDLKKLIKSLCANRSGYLFVHNVLNAFVCRHIINNISWGNEEQVSKLHFAIFFHDIYLVPVYRAHPEAREEEELLYLPDISDDEKNYILCHARLAAEKVVEFPRMPIGADTIIVQHHGVKNGEGFSTNCGEGISPLARVFMISEKFVTHFYDCFSKKEPFNLEQAILYVGDQFPGRSAKNIIQTLRSLA